MSASKFYTQHHAVEAPLIDDTEFRPYWRVRTRLDQLLLDRAISIIEWRAAQHFRSMAERVLAGNWAATGWLNNLNRGGGRESGLAERQDAINRLHKLHRVLGGFALDILEAHIVDDTSWTLLGRRYGVHAKTARSWTVTTIKALAAVIWT